MNDFDPIKYLNEPRWRKSLPGLDRIVTLLEMLGQPQMNLKFVHVAGTNGKGSCCTYISEILRCSGLKVGQYTSPFIWNFVERIRINNKVISQQDLHDITLEVKNCADTFEPDNHPTEFELMTAVAIMYFSQQNCDVVVLEAGMGGRLDSTNAIQAEQVLCSVISRIGIDHTNYLGETLGEIADEKAGIVKQGVPLVCWDQLPAAMEPIESMCQEKNAELIIPDFASIEQDKVDLKKKVPTRKFKYSNWNNLETRMIAKYQPKNAAIAIEVANVLKASGLPLNKAAVREGIFISYWPVRFEIVDREPWVVVDGGHNLQGVDALIDSFLDIFGEIKPIFIFGVLADKEHMAIVKRIAPYVGKMFTITPPSPRALSAEELKGEFKTVGIDAIACATREAAVKSAKEAASEDDVIICFGSLYSAAKLHDLF